MRIVVADGNRAMRYGVGVALRNQPDIEVVGEAEDGCAAIRLVQELHPNVLVLDLALPRIGGLEVMRELAPLLAQTRFLVFSNETRLRADALRAGAATFLAKNSPDEQLIHEIRRVASASETRIRAQRLGDFLLERNLITVAHLEAALAWQRELRHGGRRVKLGELLKQIGAISDDDLESVLELKVTG